MQYLQTVQAFTQYLFPSFSEIYFFALLVLVATHITYNNIHCSHSYFLYTHYATKSQSWPFIILFLYSFTLFVVFLFFSFQSVCLFQSDSWYVCTLYLVWLNSLPALKSYKRVKTGAKDTFFLFLNATDPLRFSTKTPHEGQNYHI